MRYLTTFLLVFFACACVRQASPPDAGNLPKGVKSVAVLPTGVMKESGAPPLPPQAAKAMEEGAAVLDQILAEAFVSNPKVRLLSEEEVNVHSHSYSAGPVAHAIEIGKGVGADAVMLWGLERYSERSGSDYGVQIPASAAFQYRLIHTESGQTLCSASFDETQQSASANLLHLKTSAKRGFKWVPVSVLLSEGVNKKLAECDYLTSVTSQEGEASAAEEQAPPDEVLPSATVEPSVHAPVKTSVVPATGVPPLTAIVAAPLDETVPPAPVLDPDLKVKEITQFLDEWRKAWEATAGPQGDMDHYGAFYAADFKNAKQDRTSWLADKRRKNFSKDWIKLKISDVTVAEVADSPMLEARFVQEYASANYSDTSRKSLLLRKNSNNWEIVVEGSWGGK